MRRAGPAIVSLLIALAGVPAAHAAADAARLRFAVSYPRSLASGPLDGRLLLLLSNDASAEPRFQVRDIDVPKSQQVFGIDVVGWKPGEPAVIDASVLGFPAESLRGGHGRPLSRAGAAAPLRDVPPRGRPRGEAADGPRRGAAVEPRARQPAQHSARDRLRPRARRDARGRARPGDPGDPAARRHALRQAHPHPERAAHEVLGAADAPRRRGAAAARLRRAPRRPASRSRCFTATSRTPWTTSASSRPTPTCPASTPTASSSTATTGSSSSSRTSSTRTGRRPASRASWWWRSSTRTRTTTTPTR